MPCLGRVLTKRRTFGHRALKLLRLLDVVSSPRVSATYLAYRPPCDPMVEHLRFPTISEAVLCWLVLCLVVRQPCAS